MPTSAEARPPAPLAAPGGTAHAAQPPLGGAAGGGVALTGSLPVVGGALGVAGLAGVLGGGAGVSVFVLAGGGAPPGAPSTVRSSAASAILRVRLQRLTDRTPFWLRAAYTRYVSPWRKV